MPPDHMPVRRRALRHALSIPQHPEAETPGDVVVNAHFGAAFIAVLVLPLVLLSGEPVTPETAAMVGAVAAATRVRVHYQHSHLA